MFLEDKYNEAFGPWNDDEPWRLFISEDKNMNREKGLAYCGLACLICGENEMCAGCRNAGCKNKERCKHFNGCKEKGLNGCWECEEFPCSGMHDKVRVLAFAQFIKQHGEEKLIDCLERNEKAGIIFDLFISKYKQLTEHIIGDDY